MPPSWCELGWTKRVGCGCLASRPAVVSAQHYLRCPFGKGSYTVTYSPTHHGLWEAQEVVPSFPGLALTKLKPEKVEAQTFGVEGCWRALLPVQTLVL